MIIDTAGVKGQDRPSCADHEATLVTTMVKSSSSMIISNNDEFMSMCVCVCVCVYMHFKASLWDEKHMRTVVQH